MDEATWGDKRIVREDEPTTGVDVTPGRDEVAAGGELGFGAGAELGSWAGAELGFGAGAELGSGAGAELGFGAGAELGSGAGAGLGFGAAGDGAGGASGDFAGGAAAEVGMVGHNGESPKDRKGGVFRQNSQEKRGRGEDHKCKTMSNEGGMAVSWFCQCPISKSKEGCRIASNVDDNQPIGARRKLISKYRVGNKSLRNSRTIRAIGFGNWRAYMCRVAVGG